jgi:hypothetical protein
VAVAIDAGVVDNGVHSTALVDLVGEFAGLLAAGQVADDDGGTAIGEIGQRGRPFGVAGVDDDLVTVIEELGRGCST